MKRCLLVVTGASKGFGRSICEAFLESPNKDSGKGDKEDEDVLKVVHYCLLARSEEGLAETQRSLETAVANSSSASTTMKITRHVMDLADLDSIDASLQQVLKKLTPADYDMVIFAQNAGSIGFIGPMATSPQFSLSNLQKTIDLNVTSLLWTTRLWAQWAIAHDLKATLVNISSLVAIQPFPSMAVYSAGKAARDMFFACLAKELAGNGKIRFLNYAPGPLETAMTEEIRAAPDLHDSLKPSYAQRLLDPKDSARVLVQLIRNDDFSSGAHIDYYDVAQSGGDYS